MNGKVYGPLIGGMIFRIQSLICKECHEPLRGRSDKKFCDDSCRLKHYRKQNKSCSLVKSVEGVLLKNRALLKEMRREEPIERDSDRQLCWLRKKGFDFNFHTHVQHLPDGRLAIMCFEEGYVVDEQGISSWSARSEQVLALLPS